MGALTRPGVQLGLLLGLVALLLAPGLWGEFVWDDKRLIFESPHIADLDRIPSYFGANLQQSSGDAGRAAEGLDIYRPLYVTALALLYQVDGANPLPFHLASLAVHLLAAALLWLLVRRLAPDAPPWAAGFVLLAFALHPVTAEAVLWASALSEPMAAAALFGAALLLVGPGDARQSAAAGLLFFVGLLSKEVIVMALPALALLAVHRGTPLRRLAPLAVAAGLMIALRLWALDGAQASGGEPGQRWLALRQVGLLWWHGLGALIAQRPVGPLHLYFEYRGVAPAAGLGAGVGFLGLGALVWARRRRAPELAVGLVAFAAMLAPVALVSTIDTWGGFGRYLYMPLGFLLVGIAPHLPRGRLAPIVAAAWLLGCVAGLGRALPAYADDHGLADAALRLQPEAPIPHEWKGEAWVDDGLVAESIPWLARAVELAPGKRRPRINLAASLVAAGRPAEALEHVETHEATFGPGARSSFLRARALVLLGKPDEAGEVLLFALERAPEEPNLLWLSAGLLGNHPEPERYRAWLDGQLPTHPNAARALQPLLGSR